MGVFFELIYLHLDTLQNYQIAEMPTFEDLATPPPLPHRVCQYDPPTLTE